MQFHASVTTCKHACVRLQVQETREASEECVPPDACQLESLADQVCRKAQVRCFVCACRSLLNEN
jgi:hypothetical protein